MPLDTGQLVPTDFNLALSGGLRASMADYRGRWLVLYFYPRDATPGCTAEGLDFNMRLAEFQRLGAEILGVSRDSLPSHDRFCARQGFGFRLISDRDEVLCNAFGVLREKQLYGRIYQGIERSTFLIDPDGRIRQSWRGVKVPGHAEEVVTRPQSARFALNPHPMPAKRTYVLDTNVLMHDPTALFQFAEHDIYLPMQVIEELDHAKKGTSESSRNARQVSRFLNELIETQGTDKIATGLALARPGGLQLRGADSRGVLHFQTTAAKEDAASFGSVAPDNRILGAILALRRAHAGEVIFVSKDINLRIKAAIAGIPSEDYENDRALDDFSLLYTGARELPAGFWKDHGNHLRSWTDKGRTFYEVSLDADDDWHPNQFLYLPGEDAAEFRVVSIAGGKAVLHVVDDYRQPKHAVWGISARNREQNFALNALMDPAIDFVTLLGTAGTGKTLLALAAGLAQTMDHPRYREIIMTRATVNVGEDIGFLPGTEEEKMTPWMGALTDNLEVLTQGQDSGSWGRAATNDLLSSRIKIRAVNFMRGRTFLSRWLILDEAQNLTPKQMKTLITRAGPGTKIICLGNVEQIDTPYLTETTSGLTYAVDRFKSWPHSAHVTLRRGERSRLADYASEVL